MSLVSEYGRILPRSITKLSTLQQRKATREIKKARYMAILPYQGEVE